MKLNFYSGAVVFNNTLSQQWKWLKVIQFNQQDLCTWPEVNICVRVHESWASDVVSIFYKLILFLLSYHRNHHLFGTVVTEPNRTEPNRTLDSGLWCDGHKNIRARVHDSKRLYFVTIWQTAQKTQRFYIFRVPYVDMNEMTTQQIWERLKRTSSYFISVN